MPKVKQQKEETSRQCKVLRPKIKYMEIEKAVLDPNSDRYLSEDYDLYVDLTPNAKYRSCVMAVESEVHRILQHLNPDGVKQEGQYRFFEDLFVLEVGKSNSYHWLIEYQDNDSDNPIQISRSIEKQGKVTLRYYSDKDKTELLDSQTYIHFICNASHVRGQKAWFIREDLFDKADDILRCGISKDKRIPHISKWTSYYGLQASDSITVTMPRMTCVKDFEHLVSDTVDEVTVTEEVDTSQKNPKVEKKYAVTNAVQREVKTMPFDGMGICDISIAKVWASDLVLDYIPGSFQIRLCGVKGCLFVMDVKKFIREKNGGKSIIINSDGDECNYLAEGINVILTDSMFKYGKFYDTDKPFTRWLEEFNKECHGYHRTFNICDYAKDITQLKDQMVTAYQPLQSLPNLTDDDIKELCKPTIEKIRKMGTDVDAFLEYQGLDEDKAEKRGSFVPPYYRGLYFNRSLVNDPYVKKKMEASINRAVEASYTGKLIVDGNYTVVCSDPYALLEWVFSDGDKSKVQGFLGENEIYSNYWNRKGEKTVTVWRNPHIYTEHWIADCKNNEAVNEWFEYLHSNIVVSIHDINLLRCNGADTDGDILATVNNTVLQASVRDRKAKTILPDLSSIKKDKPESEYVPLGDIVAQVESEIRGFMNDIGRCTNRISNLWGLIDDSFDQKETALNSIKIMSVIDSLVIDFPKTGEKIEIPNSIKKFMNKNHAKKPRFMMYLPKNIKQRNNDYKRVKNGKDSLFSDNSCVVNRICQYMISQLEGKTPIKYDDGEFQYLSLMKSVDENLQNREICIRVKERLVKFYKMFIGLVADCKKMDSKEKKPLYEAFYASCRADLLLLRDGDRYVSPDIILDCCLIACKTVPQLHEKASVYDLLWNCFPDEMVERCKGNVRSRELTQEQLEKRNAYIEKMEEKAKRQYVKLKIQSESIDELSCLNNSAVVSGVFQMFSEDVSAIKKAIKSNKKQPIDKDVLFRRRKLLYSLLVFVRRIMVINSSIEPVVPFISNSRNTITVSVLCKAIEDHNYRTVDADLKWLASKGLITITDKEIRVNTESFLNGTPQTVIYEGESCRAALKKMSRLFNK